MTDVVIYRIISVFIGYVLGNFTMGYFMGKIKIDNEIKRLTRALESDKRSRDDAIEDLLKNEDFFSWLFNPPEDDPDVLNQEKKFYVTLSSAKYIKAMIRVLEDDPLEYSRTAASYITSITDYSEKMAAEHINNCIKEVKAGKLGKRQFELQQDKMDAYMESVAKLRNLTKSIIADKAKEISKRSLIPKKLITSILLHSPGPRYIEKSQLGTYVDDATVFDQIVYELKNSEKPVYLHTTTMQNHQPYNQGEDPDDEFGN